MIRILKNSLKKGIVAKMHAPLNYLVINDEIAKAGNELKAVINKRFKRSMHVREVDAGSCGACESEIVALSNPVYDIQRFGIDFVASPRHADVLLITGPVSKNMGLALKRTYDAMANPKIVITCGDCALDGGKFKDSYYTCNGVKSIIPVNYHIPGCPPNPKEIIYAFRSVIKILDRENSKG